MFFSCSPIPVFCTQSPSNNQHLLHLSIRFDNYIISAEYEKQRSTKALSHLLLKNSMLVAPHLLTTSSHVIHSWWDDMCSNCVATCHLCHWRARSISILLTSWLMKLQSVHLPRIRMTETSLDHSSETNPAPDQQIQCTIRAGEATHHVEP